ncbi:MAG TPA: hypothetical protein VE992_04055, partial [Solirubrobacteraceae bacterium]|nr:hypothetical protein [Solirubrobacteraceae bacterium]
MPTRLSDADVAYVASAFRRQTDEERRRADAGLSPRPSYTLPDGTPMVSAEADPDLARAADAADLERRFLARWQAAGGAAREVGEELSAWLGGGY